MWPLHSIIREKESEWISPLQNDEGPVGFNIFSCCEIHSHHLIRTIRQYMTRCFLLKDEDLTLVKGDSFVGARGETACARYAIWRINNQQAPEFVDEVFKVWKRLNKEKERP